MIVAPWLQPANVLQAIHSGAGLGLQARAADQRDAEMQLRAELAAQEEARQQASAADRLRYSYDALRQARELALADDKAREDSQKAARLIKAAEDDALAKYREGVLKNQADRNAKMGIDKPFVSKIHDIGGVPFRESAPGVLEAINIPGFTQKGTVPTFNVPLDAEDPTKGRVNVRADNPLVNQLKSLAPYSATGGTNYSRLIAPPVPSLNPAGSAASVIPKFKKGQRVTQNGNVYEFDGKNWNDVKPDAGGDEREPVDNSDEEGAE